MKHYIFGLCGPKGVGKSTFAKALRQAFNQRYAVTTLITGFATPMKAALRELFPGVSDGFYEPSLKHERIGGPFADKMAPGCDTYRGVMEQLGMYVREKFYTDFLVDNMRARIEGWRRAHNGTLIVIVDDVRFESEAAFVRESGAVINLKRYSFQWSGEVPSEMGIKDNLADLPVLINNDCEKKAEDLSAEMMESDSKLNAAVYGEAT